MNAQEMKEMYVASCNICTLATALRACPQCTFNVGLEEVVVVMSPLERGGAIFDISRIYISAAPDEFFFDRINGLNKMSDAQLSKLWDKLVGGVK